MKGIPKSRGLLVFALIAALVITSGLPAAGTSYAADLLPACTHQDVGLSKEIIGNPDTNEWEVQLTVKGNQKGRSTDVVIVLDRSRSMSYEDNTGKTRIYRAKSAAKRFAEQVLEAGSRTRIAVVTFDKGVNRVQKFTNNKDTLNTAIDSINANYTGMPNSAGGTNLQAGIRLAADMMGGSTAELKSIVLISDGAPTHSYKFTGSVNTEIESCQIENGVHNTVWREPTVDPSYNYNTTIGFGDSFLLKDHFTPVEDTCPEDGSSIHTYNYPENHGIPAIYEADLIKNNVKIFAIGIGLDADAKGVLNACKNAGYFDIRTSDPTYDFPFAAAIGSEAFKAVVTDQIGSEFVLATDSPISVSKGTASCNNNIITWNIPALKSGDTATMKYTIKAKPGIIFTNDEGNVYPTKGKHFTNEQATIKYNYPEGDSFTSDFVKPTVPLTGGAVILKAIAVNSEGDPVSSTGTKVTDYKDAELLNQGRFPEEADQFVVYGSFCQVSMGAITGYEYQGWQYGESSGGSDDLTADVDLTTANQIPTVYFKYLKSGSTQTLYDVKVKYIDESDQSLIDEDVIEGQPAGQLVTAGAMEFFGYDLSGDQSSVKGCTVSTNSALNVITFYYTKKIDYVTVRVIYLDENEKFINEELNKVYSVPKGTTVTEAAIYFDGYKLAEDEASVKSATVNVPTTIAFLYKHNEKDHYTVTIKYIDGSGNQIHEDGYLYDKEVGTPVSASAISIPGYNLNDVQIKELIVNVPNHEANPPIENIITFVYKAVSVNPPGGGGGGGGGGSSVPVTTITPPALNKTDHYAYVVGYPDGEVKPLGTITREEVAVIFYRLMTGDSRKQYYSSTQPFTDVAAGRWSNDEIATLYNAKIVQGNNDGTFEPSKPITRAEFAAIASKFDKLEEVTENKFPDIENHWAKKYINSSALKGWISGYGDGTFRPDNVIIRCEAMKMINEELDRRVNTEGLCSGTQQWPDNTQDKWYYEIVLEATNTHDYQREDRPKSMEKWTKIKDNPVW